MSEKNKKLDARLDVRINVKDRETFIRRCIKCGVSNNEMLREMVIAFNENRLKITIPPNKLNLLKGIYNVNRKQS